MKKVLVLRGGALGDLIVTLPALALLRTRWPQARIELAGNATAGQLAAARGLVDAVHSQHEARWAGLFAQAPLSTQFADWLAGFDLVLSYWPDPDDELKRRFPLHGKQQFLTAAAMPTRAPAAMHYCEPLRAFGLEARETLFRLSSLSPADARGSAEGTGLPTFGPAKDFIALHPGSGSPRKNWPAENWRRLMGHLPSPVSVVLGEAERAAWGSSPLFNHTRAASGDRPGYEPLHVKNPLPLINRPLEELVHHFAQCRLFLGHDSGIAHLAAASGAHCVLLFGPTEPAMWAPPAPSVRVIRRFDLAKLPVGDVRRAVEEALADRR